MLQSLAALELEPKAVPTVFELAREGDGGFWLDRVITPLFLVLAHEVRYGTHGTTDSTSS